MPNSRCWNRDAWSYVEAHDPVSHDTGFFCVAGDDKGRPMSKKIAGRNESTDKRSTRQTAVETGLVAETV